MPEYDPNHVMTWAEYWSAMDPFLVAVTFVVLFGLGRALVLFADLVIRALMGEKP